ncbi:hypothetical protein DRJ19_02835 [Candidatus Woesearchaeota archaeon]|nr:MAG: hypothetical protein DRJ19_02835 [Candidatus Woesearchaeota archaeon]
MKTIVELIKDGRGWLARCGDMQVISVRAESKAEALALLMPLMRKYRKILQGFGAIGIGRMYPVFFGGIGYSGMAENLTSYSVVDDVYMEIEDVKKLQGNNGRQGYEVITVDIDAEV